MARRLLLVLSSLTSAAFVLSMAVPVRAQAPGVAGIWKLNEAESNNPNGLPQNSGQRSGGRGGDTAAAGGGGGRRGGGSDTFDATGGASRPGAGAQQMSELSPEETARIRMMMGLLNKAAQTLEIIVDGTSVTIKQDGSGFPKQSADGKKFTLRQPQIGAVDIKIKIDAKGMTREVTTQDDLKIVETYTLSADGKQLIVTMKQSQPVMKIEDAKIKRVYYKQ